MQDAQLVESGRLEGPTTAPRGPSPVIAAVHQPEEDDFPCPCSPKVSRRQRPGTVFEAQQDNAQIINELNRIRDVRRVTPNMRRRPGKGTPYMYGRRPDMDITSVRMYSLRVQAQPFSTDVQPARRESCLNPYPSEPPIPI